MRIAFVGKGGGGKTTLSALFTRALAADGHPVLAIDADINQHLGDALGVPADRRRALPKLGAYPKALKEYFRGSNPRIPSADVMAKTTPAGHGSRLIGGVREDNPVFDHLTLDHEGIRFAATGEFDDSDLGVSCYHSKTGSVETLLNHTVDGEGEYIVADMTAGADSFASGLFGQFDATFLACEPTERGIGVYRQYAENAKKFDVPLFVVGNKVEDDADREFLRARIAEVNAELGIDADNLVGFVTKSGFVRALEKGEHRPLSMLEEENRETLRALTAVVDAQPKDWPALAARAREIHRRNARSWANASTGQDVETQIDPDFTLGPEALAAAEPPDPTWHPGVLGERPAPAVHTRQPRHTSHSGPRQPHKTGLAPGHLAGARSGAQTIKH